MDSKDYVSLNSIISYLYREKKKINNIDYQDTKYRNFVKEYKLKIKELCEALDIDLQLYKEDDELYNIPYILGEILKIYLKQDGKKGSIISNIKNKNFEKITYEEKIKFIDKFAEELKDQLNDNEIISVVEWLKNNLKVKGKFNEDIKELAEGTKIVVNNFIDALVAKITGVKETDGVAFFNQYRMIDLEKIDEKISVEELVEKLKYNKIPHKETLTFDDKEVLVDYLKYWIINNMSDFLHIVNAFSELREEDSSEHSQKDYKDSGELLKESINDYKDMIKEQLIPKKLPPDNIDKIMDELRKNFLKE
ncbi:hypothetical protein [Clostridium sp.]|uniref:hypothetical protein n=1 Tax=Clostridium sp. TaxID=1506 RepID=UPI00284D0A6D|nr:hypothetical protein [Clostridium sp.]MDR3596446.1 hypothetical protein [Clostridium sp.]